MIPWSSDSLRATSPSDQSARPSSRCRSSRAGCSSVASADRPVEQIHCGRRIVTRKRATSSRAEDVRGAIRKAASAVVERAELLSVTERLLEVVPDDLVELAGAARLGVRGPVGEAFVQLARAAPSGCRRTRRRG